MTFHSVPAGEKYTPAPGEMFELRQAGRTVWAVDRTGLVEAIVPGYTAGDGTEGVEDAFFARWSAALAIKGNLQEAVLAAYVQAGVVDLDGHYSQEQMDVMFPDRCDDPGEPYTDRPTPDGNVSFIDPYTERTFLESLSDQGWFELVVHDDPDE